MMMQKGRSIFAALAATSLSACTSTYTGPVEVNRFVAENPAQLREGAISVSISDEISNENVREAFLTAVSNELSRLGYDVVADGHSGAQIAEIRTSRENIETSPRRGPVSVGVGGSTGSYGSGLGLGVGINLGGGERGPTIVTNLSVRISSNSGETLWEGRAELPTSINSPYSEVQLSAKTLAGALFQDFPGGNGETLTIDVKDLEETQ